MSATREVLESPLIQGARESLPYQLTVTPWASAPVTATCQLWNISDADNEVTATVTNLSGSVAITGDVITTPRLYNLTAGAKYRLQINFVDSNSNTWEAFALVNCV